MKILVTGGAGYIGSHTCKALKEKGFEPVTYDNLSRGHSEFVKWGPLVKGSLKEEEKLIRTLKEYKIQGVIHFAAFAYVGESFQQPELYYENNFNGTRVLLQSMEKAEVKSLVFSSSCSVYGDSTSMAISESELKNPISPYGRSKFMCEQLINDICQNNRLNAISLRYFNAAGASPDGEIGEWHDPETHLIPLILKAIHQSESEFPVFGKNYPTPDGTCVRDYIHVCDLANAHVLALTSLLENKKHSPAYNLGSGKGYSILEVLKTASEICESPIVAKFLAPRPGDPARAVANCNLANKELGFKCESSEIGQIIKSAWNWHRSRN